MLKFLKIKRFYHYFIYLIILLVIICVLIFIIKLPIGLHSYETNKCGYKNIFGYIIVKAQYDNCGGFYNGVAIVEEHSSTYEVPLNKQITEEIFAEHENREVKQLEPEYVFHSNHICINVYNEEVPMEKCKN